VLNTYSIPEPVVGGLVVALLMWLLHSTAGVQVNFDKTLGPPLMLAFFACIGLNADLPSLLRGGRPLVVFLAVVLGFLVLQNLTGVGLAVLLGQSPLVVCWPGRSRCRAARHRRRWGAVFVERYHLAGAKEIAIASATFGLELGGVIGGPVARHLLAKVRKTPGAAGSHQEPTLFEHPAEVRLITAPALIETLALISVCLLAGQHIARALAGTFLELPAFVCVLFVGVVLRNGLAAAGKYTVERAVSVLSSIRWFLALALIDDMGLLAWRCRCWPAADGADGGLPSSSPSVMVAPRRCGHRRRPLRVRTRCHADGHCQHSRRRFGNNRWPSGRRWSAPFSST
jgi:ESS family glutamate:Na+ symporter